MGIHALVMVVSLVFAGEAARPVGAVFYPPLPQTPRLQFLKSYGSPQDFGRADGWFSRLVFGSRREPGTLGKPYGVAIYGSKVYLCDTGNADVRVIDLATQKLSWLGRTQGIRFNKPVNASIDAAGMKFITDVELKRVVVFDRADRYLRSYEDPAGWKPVDAVASADSLYVLDMEHHQVKVVDRSSGTVRVVFGGAGSNDGELFKPTNLTRDAEGNIYVSDTVNFRIQKFDASGAFQKSFGQLGRRPGEFARPKGVAVDPEGRLYAVDAGFDNVQVFDKDGNTLIFFGGTGNDPGQMYLPAKVAIDVDPANVARFQPLADPRLRLSYLVWVTNQYGPNPLSVYGYGEWKETTPPAAAP